MNTYGYSYERCSSAVYTLVALFYSGKELSNSITRSDIDQLHFSCEKEWETEVSDGISKPMVWVGIYIAVASLFCVLAMMADLFHGFRNKKFWFPCKYFSLNAASITVIAVTMKLPVDLSSPMLPFPDQATKIGSLAFMCTVMANLMPSLASMDNETLLANVIGLSVLIITVVVNIFIQINTSAIFRLPIDVRTNYFYGFDFVMIAYILIVMMLLLLVIVISSSLAIPTSKEILESKYQARNIIVLTDQRLQHTRMSIVEKLRKLVRGYWVMAETGNPQFVMACNPLSTASGVICVIVFIINSLMVLTFRFRLRVIRIHIWTAVTSSPYKWSTIAIFITQFVGVMVGTIAPLSRCLLAFSFKFTPIWNRNHFRFFRVERYWTQKLQQWKQSHISFLSSSRRSRNLVCDSKNIVLTLCIGFQKVTVVSCKLIWVIATVVPIIVISCLYCWKSLKAQLFAPPMASRTDDVDEEELSSYVLHIDNEMDLDGKTLKGISNSINSFILKTEKEQDYNLLKLLEKSAGSKGLEIFDTDQVQSLLPAELANSWSLPIATLTCIVVALPNIPTNTVENLLKTVGEGLSYSYLVEELLNCGSEYVNLRKASMALWHEVENNCRWFGISLTKNVFKGKTATEILQWFADKSEEIVMGIKEDVSGYMEEDTRNKMIAANSMYRVTRTILVGCQSSTEPSTKKQLFVHLEGIIADIFCACFTNIPMVIRKKCHESVIEEREASVKVAAKLLGKTRKIIERLEKREVPSMDDDKMAYIDEWRHYLKQSIP